MHLHWQNRIISWPILSNWGTWMCSFIIIIITIFHISIALCSYKHLLMDWLIWLLWQSFEVQESVDHLTILDEVSLKPYIWHQSKEENLDFLIPSSTLFLKHFREGCRRGTSSTLTLGCDPSLPWTLILSIGWSYPWNTRNGFERMD